MRKKPKKRLKSLKLLDKTLWKLVSLAVRMCGSNFAGYNNCYTCGVKKHYKELHCGHYIKRGFKGTKFDLRNLKPQCVACNLYRNGMQDIFAINLEREYGYGILQDLERDKLKPFKRDDYNKLIEQYKNA